MTPARSPWIKHGFWNTLEHGVTRISDALSTLVLLWALSPEAFATLALAQAVVAPTLILFLSAETVIYRDFVKWRAEGPSELAGRLRALRLFSWGKGQLALVLSLVLAYAFRDGAGWHDRFFALIWAYSLALAPHMSAADREFLRLDLKLKELNAISLYQKIVLLAGTVTVALVDSSRIDLFAVVAAFSAVSSGLLARWRARAALRAYGASEASLAGREGPSVMGTLTESIKTFSIWSHFAGILMNWVQTMDLFFLGVFHVAARQIGLYAAVLKISNFSMALPMALSNLFSLWIGRRAPEAGHKREHSELMRLSLWLFAGSTVQAIVIYFVTPFVLAFLSRGRWTLDEQAKMTGWIGWMLGGTVFLSSTFLVGSWLTLRTRISRLFFRVYVPWVVFSLFVYSISVYLGGTQMAATANLIVGGAYLLLLWVYFYALAPVGDR